MYGLENHAPKPKKEELTQNQIDDTVQQRLKINRNLKKIFK